MREIKFRWWNEEDREIVEHVGLYAYSTGYEDDVEFMQYTGLKDKNGVEIYEGDILKWITGMEWGGGTKDKELFTIYEVKFGPNGWMPFDGRGFIYNQGVIEDSCLIGNKWENPELLEQQ